MGLGDICSSCSFYRRRSRINFCYHVQLLDIWLFLGKYLSFFHIHLDTCLYHFINLSNINIYWCFFPTCRRLGGICSNYSTFEGTRSCIHYIYHVYLLDFWVHICLFFFFVYVMIIQDYVRILSFYFLFFVNIFAYMFIFFLKYILYIHVLYPYIYTHNRFNFYVDHLGNRLGCWHVPYATLIWNKKISLKYE